MTSGDARDPLTSSGAIRKPGAVLVVDDDDALRLLVVRWLSKAGFVCVEAHSGEEGVSRAQELSDALDVIVCDVMMPGMTGFEVLERLKENPSTAQIPVVLLTAHANTETDIVKGVEGGAVEHLAKPFSGKVLVAKVRAHVAKRRSDKTLRDRLRFAETHAAIDALTGLYNRRHFETRLREEILHVRRHSRPLSLLLIDLDHFKSINDTFGHEDGDKVLKHVATIIRGVLRTEDTPCRYGGEEFVILLRESELEAAHFVGERLRTALQKNPVALGPQEEPRIITFSGGIAGAHLGNQFDVDELVSRADQMMYRAKRGGRDRLVTE